MSDFESPHPKVIIGGVWMDESLYEGMKTQLAKLEAEILEQCRLNGMGAERELKLIAEIAALKLRIGKLEVVVEAARHYKSAFYGNHQASLMQGNLFECIEALDASKGPQDG